MSTNLTIRLLITIAVMASISWTSGARATDSVEIDYMLNCQGCHLPDGRGFPARNVPSLTDHMAKFLWVDGGRAFLVQVPGAATSDLSNPRLANVLNWMLLKFSADQIPDDFAPYSEGEVAALRARPLNRVTEVREQLIEKIRELEKSKDTSNVSEETTP